METVEARLMSPEDAPNNNDCRVMNMPANHFKPLGSGSVLITLGFGLLLILTWSCRSQRTGLDAANCFDHAVAGQVLIKFRNPKEWQDRGKLEAFAREITHGAAFAEPIGDGDVALVRSLAGQSTKELQGVFERKSEVVDYVEPDYFIPLDCRNPGVGSNPDLGREWDVDKINACAVWERNLISGAIVAVIDSGISCKYESAMLICHPDFTNSDNTSQIWLPPKDFFVQLGSTPVQCPGGCFGFDATVDDSQPDVKKWYPSEGNGHGTQIAGIIAAANNNKGIVGVGFKSQILAVKVAVDDYGLVSSVIRAIDFVIAVSRQKNVRVVNCSFGFDPKKLPECDSRLLQNAFDKLDRENKMLIVASKGNANVPADPGKPHYPSDYRLTNLIAATSTDPDDKHFPSRYEQSSPNLIGAPGTRLYTTQTANYGFKEGTSFAAAVVSGGAALVLSDAQDGCDRLNTRQLQTLLLAQADSIPQLTNFIKDGRRLNVNKATGRCR
jgi:subtilisin family serine protease